MKLQQFLSPKVYQFEAKRKQKKANPPGFVLMFMLRTMLETLMKPMIFSTLGLPKNLAPTLLMNGAMDIL